MVQYVLFPALKKNTLSYILILTKTTFVVNSFFAKLLFFVDECDVLFYGRNGVGDGEISLNEILRAVFIGDERFQELDRYDDRRRSIGRKSFNGKVGDLDIKVFAVAGVMFGDAQYGGSDFNIEIFATVRHFTFDADRFAYGGETACVDNDFIAVFGDDGSYFVGVAGNCTGPRDLGIEKFFHIGVRNRCATVQEQFSGQRRITYANDKTSAKKQCDENTSSVFHDFLLSFNILRGINC